MTNTFQKKLYENGYLIVKNILNYRRDLKPVLNDMEFVMDCLIQKYAKKTEVKKVLNLNFKRKYSYISKLNIYDLDQYFNTRLPRDHVKRDSDYFATQSLWNLITHKRILDVVEKNCPKRFFIYGRYALNKPVIWNYKGISYYPHIISTKKRMLTSFHDANYLTAAPKH